MIVSIDRPFTARQGIAKQCPERDCNTPMLLFAAAGFVRGRQSQRHAEGVLSARRCKLAAIAELMAITNAGDDCRGGHSANTGNSAQQTDPRIFFGDLLEPVFIPSDPRVKRHEMFAKVKVMDHLIGDLGQVQYFTHQNILSKPNDPRGYCRKVFS
jgi:hypothetical protein